MQHRLGVIGPSIPDSRDWPFPSSLIVGASGEEIDDIMPAIEHDGGYYCTLRDLPSIQGVQNSCVWHGFPAALEHDAFIRGIETDISEAFGYQETRALRGWRNKDSGCFTRDAIEVCRKVGVVSRNLMPYNQHDYKTTPKQRGEQIGMDLYAEAARNRMAEFYEVYHVEQCIAACKLNRQTTVCITIYETFEYNTGRTGVWTAPTPGIRVEGAHLINVVGCDIRNARFLLPNWWGRDWGVDHPLADTHPAFAKFKNQRSFWWMPFNVYVSKDVWDKFALLAFRLER